MPIRRSNRIQKRHSKSHSESLENESPLCSQAVKVDIESESDQEESQKCFACKQKHPPIRRYPKTHWIQCDNCDNWWHIECACVTKDDNDKLTRHNISYSCAICVLKGSPWIKSNHDFSVDLPVEQSINTKSKSEEICKSKSKIRESDKVCQNKESESRNIIIVDNINNAQDWKSSTAIRQKLNEFETLNEVDFAYSLPRGGIALHCKTEQEVENIINSWPEKVFAESEKPHRPKEPVPCKVGYLKNIDLRITDGHLKEFLKENGCEVVSVSKVFHRSNGRPMPIRKVSFISNQDLLNAIKLEFPHKLNGKKAYCEEERRHRVVRCFSCHRFNHIAAHCPFKATCENCGSLEHTY